MYTRRWHVLLWCLLGCGLAACAGGSGSSGFDIQSENAAIQQALSAQRCVQHESLIICPAAEPGTPAPSATPTATHEPPQPTATPVSSASTPGSFPTATPTGAPTALPATAAPTARHTATATATVTAPPGAQQITLDINPVVPIACTAAPSAGCAFVLPFTARGFPATAAFRVAVRTVDPPGAWMIGPAFVANGAEPTSIDAPTTISGVASAPAGPIAAQAAVLVFGSATPDVPASVSELVDSGAEAAFVTPQFTLQPQ